MRDHIGYNYIGLYMQFSTTKRRGEGEGKGGAAEKELYHTWWPGHSQLGGPARRY